MAPDWYGICSDQKERLFNLEGILRKNILLRLVYTMILRDGNIKRWFKDSGVGTWGETEPQRIKKGDRFRIYSREGKPLTVKGQEIFVAASDPYQVKGKWVVEVDI